MPQPAFCRRIFRISLLVTLLAGLSLIPLRLSAQQPASGSAPAATSEIAQQTPAVSSPGQTQDQTQAAPQSGTASSGEAKVEEGNDVYRHSAMVQTLARMMHLSIETTARIFELLNFVIFALAIGIPLVRYMPRIIRRRGQTVLANIAAARKATEDANTRLSAIEAKLAGLDKEIAQIRAEAEQESTEDEARIRTAIKEESARIVSSAEQEIEVAAVHAQRELRNFAADLAIGQAAQQLELTPEADRALIAEFIGSTEGNRESKGGTN
jgi:F-type H+-transporting ATPase subunit b